MRRPDRWLTFLQVLMWIGLVQGVVFGLVAVGFSLNTLLFVERSTQTEGTVIGLDQHPDDNGSVSFSPVFEFVTDRGQIVTLHSNVSSNPSGFEIGDKVPVRYVKSNPSSARISTFFQTWAFEIIFAIFGAAMSLVGLFFRWRVAKRKAKKFRLKQIHSLDEI